MMLISLYVYIICNYIGIIYIYQSIYRVAEKKFDPFLYTITLTSVDGIKKKYAFDKETILPKVIAKTDRKYI